MDTTPAGTEGNEETAIGNNIRIVVPLLPSDRCGEPEPPGADPRGEGFRC
jgi:hypothetical protein